MSETPRRSLIRELLQRMHAGDGGAGEELLGILLEELHRRASCALRTQGRGHSFDPSALVNEAYLRLAGEREAPYAGRTHFLAVASGAMRQILVDHARAKRAAKRQPEGKAVPLDDLLIGYEERSFDLLLLNESLEQLKAMDADMARAVELRFFGGLGVGETAEELGMSRRQFQRRWEVARAWLYARLQ